MNQHSFYKLMLQCFPKTDFSHSVTLIFVEYRNWSDEVCNSFTSSQQGIHEGREFGQLMYVGHQNSI